MFFTTTDIRPSLQLYVNALCLRINRSNSIYILIRYTLFVISLIPDNYIKKENNQSEGFQNLITDDDFRLYCCLYRTYTRI